MIHLIKRCNLFIGIAALLLVASRCNKPLSFQEVAGEDSVSIYIPQKKILLISLEGAKGAVMENADIPNIKSLLDHSIYSWDAVCDTVSTDQAGWASLFTGVHVVKSGVMDGLYAGNHFSIYPSFLSRIKNKDEQLRIININSSASLNDTLISKNETDVARMLSSDMAVKDSAVNRLKTDNPDILLATFSSINTAGIQSGFSGTSIPYSKAIHTVDGYIGDIINTLRARKNYELEDWMIVITSNHGGKPNGKYGGTTTEERNTFVLYYNEQFSAKQIKAPLLNVPYNGTYPYFYRVDGKDHAAYTDNPIYHFGADQNFTIEFNIYAKPSGARKDNPIITNKDYASGANIGWIIFLLNQDLHINFTGADASRIDIIGPPIVDEKWHHITVSFDRQKNISIYLDGKFYISGPSIKDAGNIDAGYPLTVGTDGPLDFYFYGSNVGSLDANIADIRVWNTVLSANTISNWAFQPITQEHPDYANLIGWWKATDEAGSTFLRDYSLRGADLTIQNGLRWDAIDEVLNPSNIDQTQLVPKSIDVATNILAWMGVKINPQWQLDGQIWILE